MLHRLALLLCCIALLLQPAFLNSFQCGLKTATWQHLVGGGGGSSIQPPPPQPSHQCSVPAIMCVFARIFMTRWSGITPESSQIMNYDNCLPIYLYNSFMPVNHDFCFSKRVHLCSLATSDGGEYRTRVLPQVGIVNSKFNQLIVKKLIQILKR